MKPEAKELCGNACAIKHLCSNISLQKKNKCCKNFKEGKRCKKCPKR